MWEAVELGLGENKFGVGQEVKKGGRGGVGKKESGFWGLQVLGQ